MASRQAEAGRAALGPTGLASRRPRLHEWPLALFTSLAITGSGLLGARLLADVTGIAPANADRVVAPAVIVIAAGLAISLAHLGRPLRAALAVRRLGRNVLSLEVALASGAVVTGLVGMMLAPVSVAGTLLVRAASVLALALLVVLGRVYFLPARWPWRGTLAATPAIVGLALGCATLAAIASAGSLTLALRGCALVLIAADAVAAALGWLRRPSRGGGFSPVHPAFDARRNPLLLLRFLLVDALPAVLLLFDARAAAATMVCGVVVDRFAFYALVWMRTAEAEVEDVERVINSGGNR